MSQQGSAIARIQEMIQWTPRRQRLRDGWECLKPPTDSVGERAGECARSLVFPFYETFAVLCEQSLPVEHIGVRRSKNGKRAYTCLKCSEHELARVREWLARFERYIALRDGLSSRTSRSPRSSSTCKARSGWIPMSKLVKILLVDDLYQSGISMNYVAMLLRAHGAAAVYGLALEKTCRNDDNMGGGSQ